MIKKALIIFLFAAVFFVRFYRFSDLTRFLGDQGRDGVIIHALYEQKKFPETGAPLSTGQNTGPLHFYLIAPLFILSDFNPVVPAVGLCLLEIIGVVLMFMLSVSLFGFSIGYCLSLLYGLSPLLVYQDRVLWPPTPIPFFVLLTVTAMFMVAEKRKYWALILLFLANCALMQIHYANGITLMASGIFYVRMLMKLRHGKDIRTYIYWTIAAVLVSVIVSWPFLSYEARHGFSDLTSAFETFARAKGVSFSRRLYVQNIGTLLSMLSGYIFPVFSKPLLVSIAVLTGVLALLRKNRWSYFLVAWLAAGIIVLAYYRDTLQPQYMYGLIPVFFLVSGNGLYYLTKRIGLFMIIGLCIGLGVMMMTQSDIFRAGNNDISRVKALTDAVMKQAQGQAFSFTLISSPSYSDFHYRFYFMLNHVVPVPIDATDYKKLFLICESGGCPTVEEIHMNQKVYAMCYDVLCKLNYPIVDIWRWQFKDKIAVGQWVIYEYNR